MTARNFVWLSISGGAWSLASNWNDLTDGADPSSVAPGAQDDVTVAGPGGASQQTITGPGQAAAALFTGNTLLSGDFAIGALTLGQAGAGGLLQLAASTALSAGTASVVSGGLLAGAGSQLTVAGAVTLGSALGLSATLNATGGGIAAVASLFLASAADSIYVDTASSVAVGGGGITGQLSVAAGATLAGQGNADPFGRLTNNGTISAQGGTLAVGALSGTGALQIAAGATLALQGACGAGQAVLFAGANATLALAAEFDSPAGTLTGYAAGDAIDVRGSQISSAAFAQASAAGGVLTLYYGGQVAATMILAGNYAGDVFLTSGDGAGGTLVGVAPGAGGGGAPSPGTSTPDQYSWAAPGSGAWKTAANWTDVSRGQTPAAIAPGVHDLVSIAGAQGSFTVIAGPANAASLGLTGEVALSGACALGALSIGQAFGGAFTDGTLDLLAGTRIAAGTADIAAGLLAVSDSASSLVVAGTLTLGGGPAGVGLPVASLTAAAGGAVQAAALVLGGGSGASIVTDPTGSVDVGAAGQAVAGAVHVESGATLSGNGSVNPLGIVIDDGTILATGGTLSLGSVTGAGGLVVAAGATLELLAATAAPITLQGSAASGAAVLAFASAADAPTGTISGLVLGDAIHLEGSALTGAQLVATATGGTIYLSYGSALIARLNLAGNFSGLRVVLTPDGAGGSVITLTAASSGGGGGGQTGTDQLAWTSPVSGAWSRAANWTDETTASVASLPPGPQTPVQITGPTGTSFEDISGIGTCASLTAAGNTILTGTFATGQLTLDAAATLIVYPGSQLAAASATVSDATLLSSGAGADISASGTLMLQGAALAGAQAHGTMQCGSLALAGALAAVTVDATSAFEIGALGGAASGVLTIDTGAQASGFGSLAVSAGVTDNGAILAQGGTLWVGAVAGTGSLAIGTEATLALAATDTCPISFTGGGATLLLAGPQLPAGVTLGGFVAGDAIVTGDTAVDSVSYTPTGASLGLLTLSEAGQVVGELTVSGSYANQQFTVQPDGAGAQIIVIPLISSGPPPGTVTPDAYTWIGGHGGAWSNALNWADVTQGQTPAALAPGQNDLVSIAGGSAGVLAVTGPADAASLSLSGTVALSGTYAVGALVVGAIGVLAVGAGSDVAAASATVAGGASLDGGTLSVAGTLILGQQGGPGGALVAGGGASAEAASILLAGAGSTLVTDATSSIEIGGTQGASAGSITVDASGVLVGAGIISAAGAIIDHGTITASGGTLILGSVSGAGTLLVGVGASLDLTGAAAGLTADFAGGGTLALNQAALANGPAIADFGAGDQIDLAVSGATSAAYVQTGPGLGVLSIDSGGQTLAQLTLLGSQAGLVFDVAGSAGGGTTLTAVAAQNAGTGGGFVTNPTSSSGTNVSPSMLIASLQEALPYAVVELTNLYLDSFANQEVFEWTSADGQTVGQASDVGPSLELVGGGATPDTTVVMQPGYSAVLLEGTEAINLTDNGIGHALLVGNYGHDQIAAGGEGDTLVGATGASTTFYAALAPGAQAAVQGHDVTIVGGGNDQIATNDDAALIATSNAGHSRVFLGSPQAYGVSNDVTLNGSDTVICDGSGQAARANDNVTVNAAPGVGGELVFGPAEGLLQFVGGNTPSTVVGNGGQIEMKGGAANGSVIWAGSSAVDYLGGAGSAIIVAGSDQTQITGGSGAMTVFGGSGPGEYSGAAGSVFVVGAGASTVQAGAGSGLYIYGGGNTSVAGSSGANAYAGSSTANNIFQAGAGPETMWGGLGNDIFLAGSGNDLLVSGGGSDVFSFTNGLAGGADTIAGFVPGESTIKLDGYGPAAPAITYAFGDSILNLQDGTQIVVYGVAHLTASSITLG